MSVGGWHQQQQDYFSKDNQEQKIGQCRADVIWNNYAIEIHDKHKMTKEEIYNKEKYYNNNNYITIWIINCNRNSIIYQGKIKIDKLIIDLFDTSNKKYNFYNYKGKIFNKNNTSKYMFEKDFYSIIKNENRIPEDKDFNKEIPFYTNYVKPLLFFKQMCAGSGKTFTTVKEILDNINNNMFIVLTKIHSAKDAILEKFNEILEDNEEIKINNILCINNKDNLKFQPKNNEDKEKYYNNVIKKKYYNIEYNNKNIIIATIDSFLYNFVDINKQDLIMHTDVFTYMASNLNLLNIKITNMYKNIDITNAVIYIDEAQDLHYGYENFIILLADLFNFKIVLIGDILQSLYYEKNLYSNIITSDNWIRYIDENYNIIRRFHNPYLRDNINKLYNKYKQTIKDEKIKDNINEISIIDDKITCNNKVENKRFDVIFLHDCFKDKNDEFTNYIVSICQKYKNPSELVFIFPFIKNNTCVVHVENILKQFYGNNCVYTFTSENGQPININKYKERAKIMSVHASKGQTFKNVVCIDISSNLISQVYKCNKKGLMCKSMKNVAYTRASDNLYIIKFNKKSNDMFKWVKFTNSLELAESLPEKIINKINKIIPNFVNINNNLNNFIIDNSIQYMRYFLIKSLLIFNGFDNTANKGKSEYWAKIFTIIENPFCFTNDYNEFKQKANTYTSANFQDRRNKNLEIPIWKSNNEKVNELFNLVVNKIKRWDCKSNINKTYDNIRSYFNNIRTQIENKNIKDNDLYELFIFCVLLELLENPWNKIKYSILDNFISEKDIIDMEYVYKINLIITSELPKYNLIGLFPKFILNRLLSTKMLMFDKKEKGSKEIGNNIIIPYPINNTLNILNAEEIHLSILIDYLCIFNENNNNKPAILYLYTINNFNDKDNKDNKDNKNNIIVKYDFSNLTNEKINEIIKIIYNYLSNCNKKVIDNVIEYFKDDVKNKLKQYYDKYNDYENDNDKKNTIRNVIINFYEDNINYINGNNINDNSDNDSSSEDESNFDDNIMNDTELLKNLKKRLRDKLSDLLKENLNIKFI